MTNIDPDLIKKVASHILHHRIGSESIRMFDLSGGKVGAELPDRFELVDAAHLYNGKLHIVNGLLALDSKDRWCVGMSDTEYSGMVLYWKKRPSIPETRND